MKLSVSKSARWTALLIVSITMMFGYFFTDVMSPLEPLLTAAKGAENGLGLGWNSDEYGFFSGAYGYFNVFLLLLFFGGLILDKFGIRFTGILSTVLMFGGALLKWYALGHEFDGMVAVPFFGTYSTQVVIAALGFAIYGVGCEICGITVSKVIVKWFTGHELALAMGVQVATARLGTAAALSASLPFAKAMGGVSASVALGAVLLCAGVLVYLVYCVMDKKEDASAAAVATEPEEGFKFSDLGGLFKTTGFWYVAFLCLMFYAGVFPFLKFATKLMIFKYGVDANLAGLIPAMLPFGTIFLTPLFGSIYDKYGKGATLMIIGSCLLTFVHVMFALPINSWVLAIVLMLILGIAFGLVPSAMWPSVPKIIPMKLLGTAYALIFYIQNIGLALIPVWIGKVNQANTGADGVIDYTQTMTIFAAFGVIAIIISFLLLFEDKRKGYGLQKPNVKTMNATPESLIKDYADPIEQQEIDKFVCSEMGRQIHRYIKGMIISFLLLFEDKRKGYGLQKPNVKTMNATPESLIKDYADPIEQQEIDKFVCSEMGRQIHRYIKGMSGTKQAMLKFEERLVSLSVPEKEKAIAKYIDLNRKALDGLDLKMILVRSVANYCDTFQYMLDFVNDKRKMVFYYQRIKAKYIQYHEVFEQDGKFGMKDHQGNIMLSPSYDFLRTCYIYNDDLSIMPVIAEKNGKMGLVMPDGNDTVVADFLYDEICLRDEYPYFEASREGISGFIDKFGNFVNS